jgi:phospholipid/cholesterol/gamma-HCH transport system substrate-binding protein
MAVQDLTPQLRTRLSRLEKLVGWFVTAATLLLLAGLAYYVTNMAKRKGWFLTKAPYYTYLESGAGIKVGGKVRLMGFDAGEITKIIPEAPDSGENVYVEFEMFAPNYGYVWDDSIVKVRSQGLLGDRWLEVTKGGTRSTRDLHATYKEENGRLVAVFSRDAGAFTNWQRGDKPFELYADEPPELASQLDDTVAMLKESLTNILQLTNALARTLNNAAEATENANELLRAARPLVRNITTISENLKEPRGSLGEWLLPIAMNYQITALLTNANSTVSNVNDTVLNANSAVTNANTNLVVMFAEITQTLENLSGITGNLKAQVDRNNNIVSEISKLIIDTDDMVQGLKRHWLLRSAFKDQQKKETAPRPAPKGSGR